MTKDGKNGGPTAGPESARWCQRPWCVAAATWATMALLCLLYVSPYDYNPTALVRFGKAGMAMAMNGDPDRFCRELPRGTVVLDYFGDDGQAYYWMATLFPSTPEVLGHIDSTFRYQRIGFPLLARALGGSDHRRVILAMIGINLIAPGLLAWAVASRLRAAGINVWWALPVGINAGAVISVYKSLTDSLSLLFVGLGWLAYEKGSARDLAAAVLWWNAALLTREQNLGLVALAVLWELLRRRTWRAALLSLSVLGFALWEGYLTLQVGSVPLLDLETSLTLPGAGVVEYLRKLPPFALDKQTLLTWSNIPMIAFAVLGLVLGIDALRKSREPAGFQLASAGFLFLCLDNELVNYPITSAARIGMVMFLFMALLLPSRPGKALKGAILASFLLAAAVAAAFCFFPVRPYVVT